MNITEIRRYEMLIRVKELGAAHADAFPASSVGGQMFAAVAAAVDQLHGHVAAQASGRGAVKEATTSKAAARTTLRGTLEAISHTSRALALDTPGIADKFRVPRSRNDQRLLGAARAFIVDAQPLLDAFVTHNLPASFVDGIERVEELFLCRLLAAEEVDVVNEKEVGLAVATPEVRHGAFCDRRDHVVRELLRRDERHPATRNTRKNFVRDGLHEVCLAQASGSINEERVVGLARGRRDSRCSRSGEFI